MIARILGGRFARFAPGLLALCTAPALVGVTAAPAAAATSEVGTISQLESALNCSGTPSAPTTIRLTADMSAPGDVLTNTCFVVVDLAGHDLAFQSFWLGVGTVLTIDDSTGGGSLTADASAVPNRPGIRTALGSFIVDGGTVTARGGAQAAGIGSSYPGVIPDFIYLDAGTTTINGGTVDATGGKDGSGIGGGFGGGGGTTTINGGTVVATGGSTTGAGTVGIGGYLTQDFSTVAIHGGNVTAHGRGIGPGIGSSGDPGGKVSITGGTVTATGDALVPNDWPYGPGGPAIGGLPDMHLDLSGGTLRLPPTGWLYVPDTSGTEVVISGDGVVDGTAGPSPQYGLIFGEGKISNGGAIRLPTDRIVGLAAGAPITVTGRHYQVSFDTQGGSTAPDPVRVYASSFADGNRALPADPTWHGHLFKGWNTAADGSGDPLTPTTVLPGSSSNGTPVPLTAYAQWEQLSVTLPEPTVSGVPEDGQTLTAHVGPTTPANATLGYQWVRFDAYGTATPIAGAYGSTYVPGPSDVGARLGVEVTASVPDYRAATRLSAPIGPVTGHQRIAFSTSPPSPARVGETYTPAASGDVGSGNPVVISVIASSHGACSIDGDGVVHFDHVGVCSLLADIEGNDVYPMAQAFQDIEVTKGRQAVAFTSDAPDPGAVGETYVPTAVGGGSGSAVTYAVVPPASGAAAACSVSGGVVTFEAAGTCDLRADQAGDADYADADPAFQSIAVVEKALTTTTVQVRPDQLVAAVRDGSGGTPTGSVTFIVDGDTVGTAALVPAGDGEAHAALPTGVPAGGPRVVEAVYSGDPTHAASRASTTRTDPVVTTTIESRKHRTRGWYRTPVRVVFDCRPGSAPVDCPLPKKLRHEGADQQVVRTASAADGGSTTVRVKVSIDRTRPTVRATGVRDGATYDELRKPECAADDALSGIQACTVKLDRTPQGGGRVLITYRVRAVDVAGNRRAVRGSYLLRR